MPYNNPATQAYSDYVGGENHLSANPYPPDSAQAQAWVEEMLKLERIAEEAQAT